MPAGGPTLQAERDRMVMQLDDAASNADQNPKVIKGGSHLCASSYCPCYRPAAMDTSTRHLGFRCLVRIPSSQYIDDRAVEKLRQSIDQ